MECNGIVMILRAGSCRIYYHHGVGDLTETVVLARCLVLNGLKKCRHDSR